MIYKGSPLSIVHISDRASVAELRRWCYEQDLLEGESFEFYGKSIKDKVAWGFADKDKAMLFKLTFGGL